MKADGGELGDFGLGKCAPEKCCAEFCAGAEGGGVRHLSALALASPKTAPGRLFFEACLPHGLGLPGSRGQPFTMIANPDADTVRTQLHDLGAVAALDDFAAGALR